MQIANLKLWNLFIPRLKAIIWYAYKFYLLHNNPPPPHHHYRAITQHTSPPTTPEIYYDMFGLKLQAIDRVFNFFTIDNRFTTEAFFIAVCSNIYNFVIYII